MTGMEERPQRYSMQQMDSSTNYSTKLELPPEAKKLIQDNFLKFLKIAAKKQTWPEEKIKDALHKYILKTFNQDIPRIAICPNHDAPFDFVYDAFVSKYRMMVAMGSRS